VWRAQKTGVAVTQTGREGVETRETEMFQRTRGLLGRRADLVASGMWIQNLLNVQSGGTSENKEMRVTDQRGGLDGPGRPLFRRRKRKIIGKYIYH